MSHPITRRVIPFRSPNVFPVSCPTHGDFNYGYTVCLCIAKSMLKVDSVTPPTNRRLGVVSCGRSAGHRPEEFVLMCAKCVAEKGLNRPGGKLTA
jgi:hypothetical protein